MKSVSYKSDANHGNIASYVYRIKYSMHIVFIFSRQASFTRQAFLTTSLHGSRSKTGKRLRKSSAMLSYVKLMRHPLVKRPVFPTVPL